MTKRIPTDDSPIEDVPVYKRVLCGEGNPLRKVADFLAYGATGCWCCSFWRGIVIGGLIGGAVVATLLHLFYNAPSIFYSCSHLRGYI